MLSQREWDIAQLESQLKVKRWYQEWTQSLMQGRNPAERLEGMTPEDVLKLQSGEMTQILPTETGEV
jgi:hypothetical protein